MLSETNKTGEMKLESSEVELLPESEGPLPESEGPTEESATPKVFPARRISLTTASKPSPGAVLDSVSPSASAASTQGPPTDVESGGQAGRKRRWGFSTAVTSKKPSISITTDSLKSLIPDMKPSASQEEGVVELHPGEGHLSVEEEEEEEEEVEEEEEGTEQGEPKGLKIRRTVTQVVPAETRENGQEEPKMEEEEQEVKVRELGRDDGAVKEESKEDTSLVSMETAAPSASREADTKKVTPSDTLVRRSISQQKSGVSVTIDDPVRTAKQLSPPRSNVTNIVHVCNLVRPFTLGQLKELLNRTGTLQEEGFWIDKIKSHCYVTYPSTEEAVATRTALHGVKWPQSNPKFLRVDFVEQDELDFHRGLLAPERPGEEERGPPGRPAAPPPLLPEREWDRGAGPGARDQWAEREREMERRERTRAEREWDRDKVRDFGKPGEDREGGTRRSRSRERERRRKERGKSKERKTDKKEKAQEEPPAKLLDDLFCKTTAAPCIYWLPLTEQQAVQRELERAERMKEREKRRKELQEEEDRKREEERKERAKAREEAAATAGGASGPGGSSRGTGEGDRDRDRQRERERGRDRDREGDKRKEGYRSRTGDSRPAGGSTGAPGGGRRSRSRSNPPARDRRH